MMPSRANGGVDRSVPPPPGPLQPFHLPDVRAGELPNGLGIRSMQRGRVPLVSGCVVVDAGEAALGPDRAGLAVLAADSLQGGTGRRSGAELAEAFERLGSSLRASAGWSATSVEFTCVAERLESMLSLVTEVLREPRFPVDEVERVRRQRLATIRQRRMEPDELADDELDRAVFASGHPYHRPLGGTEETVGSLTPDEVRAYASGRYAPRGGGFVLVGDVAPDRVVALAEEHFGTWEGGGSPPAADAPASSGKGGSVVVVNRDAAVQSEIRIGLPAPPRGHPDEIALRVANLALGGAFTSRLNMSLRERHGFTYGARSGFSFRKTGGLFSIATAVQTEVTAAALGEAMGVFRRFAEEGPSNEELDRSREYLAGVFPLRMETTAQLAGRLVELVIFGFPEDYHHRYRDRIRSVDGEAARRAVRTHLEPARAAVVLVADADRVVASVEELDLGDVEVLGA